MTLLKGVSITFNTHDDDKDASTAVHVFIKNRLDTSGSPEQNTDFISNLLAYQRYLVGPGDLDPRDNNAYSGGDLHPDDRNPYLAYGIGLAPNETFDNQSSRTFDLTLRSPNINAEEIVLPVANIHIQTDGDDQWIFDYTVTLTFDNGLTLPFSSNASGMTGIVLDQGHQDHSGIGIDNPLRRLPTRVKPETNAILRRVTLEFLTGDDDKNNDTRLNVHIVNRLSGSSERDIAVGLDLFKGQSFPDGSLHKYSWASHGDGSLASDSIRLADIILPVVYIIIGQDGSDRWKFDYQVTFEFTDPVNFNEKPQIFSSRTSGIVLDQDTSKHAGVYRGRPFPTVAPATAPRLTSQPIDRTGAKKKLIPLAFLDRKLAEFINDRNGIDVGPNPPIKRVRFHNSGNYDGFMVTGHGSGKGVVTLPESYVDLRSVTASDRKNDYPETVRYVSSTINLSRLSKAGFRLYFNDINSNSITLLRGPDPVTPWTLKVGFDISGPRQTLEDEMDFIDEFSISLPLTLDLAHTIDASGLATTVVDVMSWVPEIENMHIDTVQVNEHVFEYHYTGTFLHESVDLVSGESKNALFVARVVNVALTTANTTDIGGQLKHEIRDRLYDRLRTPDPFSGRSPRDGINSMVTSWLLGGVADDGNNTDSNNCVIESLGIECGNIAISYRGPRNVFAFETPADWPTKARPNPAVDFSPGTLSNIDHIVVLTMENRSFDHMLGYLSLPVSKGGMGRSDVDGLKGGESNIYNGTTYPSFPLADTYFSPDPPHGYEPVHQAIDGGRMSGFVKTFADEHGDTLAGEIMGHHTAATVPVYDALARDFAIGHRWFAAHPGETFPNRFYELTGRLNLDPRGFWEFEHSNPLRPVFTKTIFDYLDGAVDPITAQNVTWTYFEHHYCFLRFFEAHTFDTTNIVDVDDPEAGFYACARAGRLPNVSFIDPHFVEFPPGANADGPPADVKDGQALVSRIVEAVVAGPAWNKTLLIIIYDEHGGFYDHVSPSAAPRVSRDLPIDTRGVRVPAFVISPWVAAGTVFGDDGLTGGGDDGVGEIAGPTGPAVRGPQGGIDTPATEASTVVGFRGPLHFDHTSILKTIARRFLSSDPPFLGARYAAANDLSSVIGDVLRAPQFLPFIPYNIEYVVSTLMLTIRAGDPAPGTIVWQAPRDGAPEQDYSFEDAGDGFVYIRSRLSNLYLTLQEPNVVVISANEPVTPAGPPPTAAPGAAAPGVIQDVKYLPEPLQDILRRPALQRWKVSPVGRILDGSFEISCEALPGMVLQPADPTQNQSRVVLADPGQGVHLGGTPNAWHVNSPLINDNQIIAVG